MAEWMTCPGCQLRHTRRPDGLCPRCKQPVEATSAAVGAPEAEPSPVAAPPRAAALAVDPASRAAATSPSVARLGGLAQTARGNQLKSARGIMLFVGVLSMLVNGYFFAAAPGNVQEAIDKEIGKLGPGFVADPVKVAQIKSQAVRATQLIAVAGVVLGMAFVVCAALVQKHPVPVTITALALYLGGNAIFGLMDPSTLAAGAIMKIFIVIALFKAVQAAVAYQKELTTAAGT